LIKPYSAVVKLEDAYDMKYRNRALSLPRYGVSKWLHPEFLTIEAQKLVVDPSKKGFADLYVKPVSFGQKSHEYIAELYWMYNHHFENKREEANG